MATYTTNLNLIKPEATDFYNVEDFNNNADIIDRELGLLNGGGDFKNKGVNGLNIDSEYNYCYVVGIDGADNGTRPAEEKINVINLYTAEMATQIAIQVNNSGATTNNMWTRNKYGANLWSAWQSLITSDSPLHFEVSSDGILEVSY